MEHLFSSVTTFVFSTLTLLNAATIHHALPVSKQNTDMAKTTTITGSSAITMYGKTVYVELFFPKQGGEVSGNITGSCTGTITGNYSGGDTGTIHATTHATCPILFTSINGIADFMGKADLATHSINGNYIVHADSIEKNGKITFTLS